MSFGSGEDTEARLRRIRGGGEAERHNARTIAALTSNPGCVRRAILDAAGVSKPALAKHIRFPMPFGRSRFAITRGIAFEAQVKADSCAAELLTLLREVLRLELPEVGYFDLNDVGGNEKSGPRHAHTRSVLTAIRDAPNQGTLFDHPMLRLEVGGHDVYLEPDLIALQWKGSFHIVEIKSFPIIDGQADAEKVAAAAMQSAVYVHAMRALLAERGLPAAAVSETVVLVCPKDFSNRPTAAFVDVRRQLTILRRQLARITRIDALLSSLPPQLCLSVQRPHREVIADLEQIEARYRPECLNNCDLARFCRDRATGYSRSLGRSVAEDLGGVEHVATVLELARGNLTPSPEQEEAARQLRRAWSLRGECIRSCAA